MKVCCREALTGRAENIVVVVDGAPEPRTLPLDLQIGLWGLELPCVPGPLPASTCGDLIPGLHPASPGGVAGGRKPECGLGQSGGVTPPTCSHWALRAWASHFSGAQGLYLPFDNINLFSQVFLLPFLPAPGRPYGRCPS